jgi:hypothetical protein
MARIIKSHSENFLVISLIFLMVTGWIFAGWPQIWKEPPLPPEIKEVQATTTVNRYATDCTTGGWSWNNRANAQGAPTLGSDATFGDFSSTNSAYIEVSSTGRLECTGYDSTSLGDFVSARVIYSFATDGASGGDDHVALMYNVGSDITVDDVVQDSQKSNTTHGGYWAYDASNITSWADVGNAIVIANALKEKGPDRKNAYVDAAWIEVTYTPANQAPTVDSVSISPSPIDLNADTTKTVTITVTITDNDGCEDVFTSGSITGVFYDAAAVDDTCTQNDNNCYTGLTLTEVNNTCTGVGDYTADASVDVDVWFHANPSSQWTAKVKATDSASNSHSNTQTVTINTLIAFKLDTSSIPYGTVSPNEVSSQQVVLITSTGNAAVDVQLSGTNLTWSGDTIDIDQQKYSSQNGFNWETQGEFLSGDPICHELSTGKPLEHPSVETENVYWKLKVPTGKAAGGPYEGTNYFDVVSDTTCP